MGRGKFAGLSLCDGSFHPHLGHLRVHGSGMSCNLLTVSLRRLIVVTRVKVLLATLERERERDSGRSVMPTSQPLLRRSFLG